MISKMSTCNGIKLCEKIHGFCAANVVSHLSIRHMQFAVTFVSPDHPKQIKEAK